MCFTEGNPSGRGPTRDTTIQGVKPLAAPAGVGLSAVGQRQLKLPGQAGPKKMVGVSIGPVTDPTRQTSNG